MQKYLYSILVLCLLLACKQKSKDKPVAVYQRVGLKLDTLNVVKRTDTMVIYSSVCRGCAYEQTAGFGLEDSLQVVELYNIETADNNPPDMDGGSLQKSILLVPRKTGTTRIKLFSFLEQPPTAADSARFTEYSIQVQN